MAAHKPYIILAEYPSSSSSAIHQVRRGGDSVLYCICKGWAHSKTTPKTCKHTKDYVAKNPGTSYGPQYAPPVSQAAAIAAAACAPWPSSAVATEKAGADWRAMLLAEKKTAVSRVKQDVAALEAYTRDLFLD